MMSKHCSMCENQCTFRVLYLKGMMIKGNCKTIKELKKKLRRDKHIFKRFVTLFLIIF